MYKRFIIAFLCSAFLWSCTPEGIIPEKTLANIYRDIYVTDQYISTDLQKRQAADTMRVYEAICLKYGYTEADFKRSVEYYLQTPEDFANLLKPAYAELKRRETELEKEIARLDNLMTRWELLDTLPKLADRRILGNGYYRALYQLFYKRDTLRYHTPMPDTGRLNAPWSNFLIYETSVLNVPGRVPYLFGVEWIGMDPELINDPWRWNHRKQLPRWYILERDHKDSIRFIQDSLRRAERKAAREADSLARVNRRAEMDKVREQRNKTLQEKNAKPNLPKNQNPPRTGIDPRARDKVQEAQKAKKQQSPKIKPDSKATPKNTETKKPDSKPNPKQQEQKLTPKQPTKNQPKQQPKAKPTPKEQPKTNPNKK